MKLGTSAEWNNAPLPNAFLSPYHFPTLLPAFLHLPNELFAIKFTSQEFAYTGNCAMTLLLYN